MICPRLEKDNCLPIDTFKEHNHKRQQSTFTTSSRTDRHKFHGIRREDIATEKSLGRNMWRYGICSRRTNKRLLEEEPARVTRDQINTDEEKNAREVEGYVSSQPTYY